MVFTVFLVVEAVVLYGAGLFSELCMVLGIVGGLCLGVVGGCERQRREQYTLVS